MPLVENLEKNWDRFLTLHAGFNPENPDSAVQGVVNGLIEMLQSFSVPDEIQRKNFGKFFRKIFNKLIIYFSVILLFPPSPAKPAPSPAKLPLAQLSLPLAQLSLPLAQLSLPLAQLSLPLSPAKPAPSPAKPAPSPAKPARTAPLSFSQWRKIRKLFRNPYQFLQIHKKSIKYLKYFFLFFKKK